MNGNMSGNMSGKPIKAPNPGPTQALERGLAILKEIRSAEIPLTAPQISQRCNIPTATVIRLTATLISKGFLHCEAGPNIFSLGPQSHGLGRSFVSNLSICNVAWPTMQNLAQQYGVSVSLGVAVDHRMIYLQSCLDNELAPFHRDVGAQVHIVKTAMGRAYLWALPTRTRNSLLQTIQSQYAEDQEVIKEDSARMFAELDDVGFCSDFGLWRQGVLAVATPIILPGSEEILAIHAGGTRGRITADSLMKKIGPDLVTAAQQITQRMEQANISFWN